MDVFVKIFIGVWEEERWHFSLQKLIDEIHLRATSDRFLRRTPLDKPFSIISDPVVTEALANELLEHLNKTSEKRAALPA